MTGVQTCALPIYDRVLVLDKHTELGGLDAGYYIAQVNEMVNV